MEVIGYSERGILNALFHNLAQRQDAPALLGELIVGCFPFGTRPFAFVGGQVLIEQSFSDFGDADALMLMRGEGENAAKCAIFIEAKVKTCQIRDWLIADEFAVFQHSLNMRVPSSNLFAQLYHKQRLVDGLQHGGIQRLQEGIPFPPWSSKQIRRIGNNGVVLEATNRLSQHLGEAFFVAIVPDTQERLAASFRDFQPIPIRRSTVSGTLVTTAF